MGFALGVCIALALFSFIFAFLSAKSEELYLKWFFLVMTFGAMTFSFDIFRRFASLVGITNVESILESFTIALISITLLLIFLFFLFGVKMAIELWFPKKKSFKHKRVV